MFRNTLLEEKRRLEARVTHLEEELEEEQTSVEQLSERSKKMSAQVLDTAVNLKQCMIPV